MKRSHTPARPSTSPSRAALACAAAAAAALVAGCGGGGDEPGPIPGPTPNPTVSLAQRSEAAKQTVDRNALCSAATLGSYYWEIGDATGRLASGSVGTGVDASTGMSIASASKWLYGAYVVQARGGLAGLSTSDIQALNFTSGYSNFSFCDRGDTIDSCLASGRNGLLTQANVGRYAYDGGHMQKHASTGMGLGAADNQMLANAMRTQLGFSVGFTFAQPQPAGGVISTAEDYATFLRRVLDRQLLMRDALGTNAVCTNPLNCSSAVRTPAPASESWSYSLGHWVETAPQVGDGAISSAGAFGFYPWIDASKSWYGVLARQSTNLGSGGFESAACGRLVRKAWVTGVAQ